MDIASAKPRFRTGWSSGPLVALVCLLCGCDARFTGTNGLREGGESDHAVASRSAESPATTSTEVISAADPSLSDPVTATMQVRPPTATAGETVELLVYVRIAGGHYVHGPSSTEGPFKPIAVDMDLPDALEAIGDWGFPHPEKALSGEPIYRDSLLLRRSLRVRSNAQPQTAIVDAELHYQACNDELCWPPRKLSLSATCEIQSERR
jgi:hypothetical protein